MGAKSLFVLREKETAHCRYIFKLKIANGLVLLALSEMDSLVIWFGLLTELSLFTQQVVQYYRSMNKPASACDEFSLNVTIEGEVEYQRKQWAS